VRQFGASDTCWEAPQGCSSLLRHPRPTATAPNHGTSQSNSYEHLHCCRCLLPSGTTALEPPGLQHSPTAGGFGCPSGFRLSLPPLLLSWLQAGPTSPASRSLLSESLFNKTTQKTAIMRTKPNGNHTLVNHANTHVYINDSTANHSCVAAFLLTLVVIWTATSLDWRLPLACRYHPRLKESKPRANTQS